jgi:hypothetical protein
VKWEGEEEEEEEEEDEEEMKKMKKRGRRGGGRRRVQEENKTNSLEKTEQKDTNAPRDDGVQPGKWRDDGEDRAIECAVVQPQRLLHLLCASVSDNHLGA